MTFVFTAIMSNLKIQFPLDFEQRYKEYKTKILGMSTNQESDLIIAETGKKPYTLVEGGRGYFKVQKQGKKITVGGKDTRHFRLLQCLCEPHFGVQKTTDAIFEAIRLPKDKNNTSLSGYSQQRNSELLKIIEFAKKELQKNDELQGKIKYKMDGLKKTMWLELEG